MPDLRCCHWLIPPKTLGILLVCTLIGLWFKVLGFSEANIITVYILGVLLDAMVTKGRLYSAATSIFERAGV
ncbi:DUF4118 domain-containing protein [Paenibacillus rhizoplanae]